MQIFSPARHVELTEEDKERLKGSYKVAKKLEKLESKWVFELLRNTNTTQHSTTCLCFRQKSQNESDDDSDGNEEAGDGTSNGGGGGLGGSEGVIRGQTDPSTTATTGKFLCNKALLEN